MSDKGFRLKLVSDGTAVGTTLQNVDTGEYLCDVTAVSYSIESEGVARCVVTVELLEAELDVPATARSDG